MPRSTKTFLYATCISDLSVSVTREDFHSSVMTRKLVSAVAESASSIENSLVIRESAASNWGQPPPLQVQASQSVGRRGNATSFSWSEPAGAVMGTANSSGRLDD